MAKKKFVFIITHSFDRPDLVAGALQLATNMKAFDTELDFSSWTMERCSLRRALPNLGLAEERRVFSCA